MEGNNAGASSQAAGAAQHCWQLLVQLEAFSVNISTKPSLQLRPAAEQAAAAVITRIISTPENLAAITAYVDQAVAQALSPGSPAGAWPIPQLTLQQQQPPAHGDSGTAMSLHALGPQQLLQQQQQVQASAAAADAAPPLVCAQLQNAGPPHQADQQQAPPVSQPAAPHSSKDTGRKPPASEAAGSPAGLHQQVPARMTPHRAAKRHQALQEAVAADGRPHNVPAVTPEGGRQQVATTDNTPHQHQVAAAAAQHGAGSEIDGSSLIGRRLEVYWPRQKEWYPGIITKFSKRSKKHTVSYDDGDVKIYDLATRKYKWLQELQAEEEEPAAVTPAEGNKAGRGTRTALAAATAELELQQQQASADKKPAPASVKSKSRTTGAAVVTAAVDHDIDATKAAATPNKRPRRAEDAAATPPAASGVPAEQQHSDHLASEGEAAGAAGAARTTDRKRGQPGRQPATAAAAAAAEQQPTTRTQSSVAASQVDGSEAAAGSLHAAPAPANRRRRGGAKAACEQQIALEPPVAGEGEAMVVDKADQQQQVAKEAAAAPAEEVGHKKRGRKAAAAAPAQAVDNAIGAAAIPVQASSRQAGSRRPLSETQPLASAAAAAAAGSDAEAASDSRATKRRKANQQQQQEAADLTTAAAAAASNKVPKGRKAKQPAGSTPAAAAAAALALSRQGSAAVSSAASQLPPEREAADARLQKEAADNEYPAGWQQFPDSSKDRSETSASATEKEKRDREKEAELQALVAAAELPCLAPGQGQLRQDTQGCCYRRDIADVCIYRLGDPTGHHAKLWRKTPQDDGSFIWEQLSTSCHDCQHQHVRWDCPHPQHTKTAGRTSYCNRCLHMRYRHTAMSLADLHKACPRCRGMCTCKSCLRQPDHADRVKVEEHSPGAMAAFGGYVLKFVGPPLKQWLQHQQQEAAAGGYQDLADLPVEKLIVKERMNCDRCGTNLIGLYAHCPVAGCEWDICNTCMHELRQAKQQGLAGEPAAAHSGAGGAAAATAADAADGKHFKWSCCNPRCSSTVAAIKRQYAPRQQRQQQQQQDAPTSAGPGSELPQQQQPMQNGLAEAPAAVAEAAADLLPATPSVLVMPAAAAETSAAASTPACAGPGALDAAGQAGLDTENAASSGGKRQRKKSHKLLEAEETEQLLLKQPALVKTAETAAEGHCAGAAAAVDPPAAAAPPVDVKAVLRASLNSRRCSADTHSVHGDELWSVDGAAALELHFMLPGDLVETGTENAGSGSSQVLLELRQIAERYGDFKISDLQLSDCPFLLANAPLHFPVSHSNKYTAPATGGEDGSAAPASHGSDAPPPAAASNGSSAAAPAAADDGSGAAAPAAGDGNGALPPAAAGDDSSAAALPAAAGNSIDAAPAPSADGDGGNDEAAAGNSSNGTAAAGAGSVRPITLADLMSDDWWSVLPAGVRDVWRRKANSSVYLFTPHTSDLQWPPQQTADAAAASSAPDHSDGVDGQGPCGVEPLARVTLARLVFWARWLVRDPIIVRGLKGRIPWDPMTMVRAMKNFNSSEDTVTVMDCADFHKIDGIKAASFFRGYVDGFWRLPGESVAAAARGRAGGRDPAAAGAEPAMLKVRDWPPAEEFRKELPRHFMDFIERLPARCYTDPRLGRGPLNLSTALCASDNPTDLGPKGYLAYGRWQEATAEGDSVTKMHLDMTDAINILVDVQPGGDAIARQRAAAAAAAAGEGGEGGLAAAAAVKKVERCGSAEPDKPGYGGAGAVWDIVRQSDVPRVSKFLTDHAASFTHQGLPVAPEPCSAAHKNPILSQHFMLVDSHRQLLKEAFMPEQCVEMLHFEQHLDEGVFIPGGSPHQVRNLQSCTKVAVDYVSPEALSTCLAQRLKLRELDLWCGEPIKEDDDGVRVEPQNRDFAEKLQSQLIMLRAALAAAGLSATPQRPLGNLEPELPEVAADARVTRAAGAGAGSSSRRRPQQQGGRGRKKADSPNDTTAEEEEQEEPVGLNSWKQNPQGGAECGAGGRQQQQGVSAGPGRAPGAGRGGGAKRGGK